MFFNSVYKYQNVCFLVLLLLIVCLNFGIFIMLLKTIMRFQISLAKVKNLKIIDNYSDKSFKIKNKIKT